MRALTDAARLKALMDALGRTVHQPARVYVTGGASAVLLEWRDSTIDVDVMLEPDHDEIYRAIATLTDSL